MHYELLSKKDRAVMDALLAYHGGAMEISDVIQNHRNYEWRKAQLQEKGFGDMITDAEALIARFPKAGDFEKKIGFQANPAYGTARSQVSGFQGAWVTHRYMKRVAATAGTDAPCFVPQEMISVVGLTDKYVYSGDLLATLAMTENIMQTSKFCTTHLIGTPIPEARFQEIENVTGKTFERRDTGDGNSGLIMKNQGTFFGNFGGIEVANDNYLIYLDGITRAAKETGADFFLNPSWNSIIGVCYYGREIPNLHIKISMLLSTQGVFQFRMLLNIIKEYLRDDGTSPIYEINIGNGATAETFIQCAEELDKSGIKGMSLAAHIYINPDLGMEGFNWTENMHKVLTNGTDMTYKYESDGTAREMDTMEAYFLSDDDRTAAADKIGDVIFYKSLQASKDGMDLMRKGIKAEFAKTSY